MPGTDCTWPDYSHGIAQGPMRPPWTLGGEFMHCEQFYSHLGAPVCRPASLTPTATALATLWLLCGGWLSRRWWL
eukprot:6642482-Prymnesium_polylepis.1